MKVFILIIEPKSQYEDFEGNDFEVLGIFKTEEKAKEKMRENMTQWSKYCGITEDNYIIEPYEVEE